ncbi:ABC-F family ATP-binding cassette domain-containing protein [Robiginitalea sp. M366]|uniref:ABC-F family ATP-binding cassette domain-containing protein n=1 Tax=Robiginitalea aestuariiviva TaxID=3036903 RepID=UPI00240E859B|nr:ABC-F family ATP-binding cassette domain-containing protein [Robiginitalea aestuariiviva]MDG1571909.1 ABC-F family ATP-binding cassette domain-containing protein [Robiginitalea aestuariiviva]
MVNVHKLCVQFAGESLFEDLSFRLGAGDRVGLIGKNGAGKSTLLRLLSGENQPTSGTLAREKELSIGFLKQDLDFETGFTVLEEAYKAFAEIQEVEAQLARVNQALAERTDYESEAYHQLMVDLSELTHRFELIGGYRYQGDTEKVLLGLGFRREDFQRQTTEFSGGWRMRIELAKLLLQEHDLLLLDEPTNHLDIESIIWLEEFLQQFPGAVMLVSHDKMFLDRVTNRTIEISLGRLYDYRKPYSEFLELREEIRQQQLSAQKNQQREIQQAERLIERFRAKSSKASMAQSLIKKLDRMDRIEVDTEDTQVMNLRFPVSVQPGKVVAELKGLSKAYGKNQVLNGIDLMVERGSKMAFVGQNGQGKTTLARILVGELDHQGDCRLGHNVQLGYFAQNQAEYLDGNKTVEDTMLDAATEQTRPRVRDILGAFLFRGEEVDKPVKVLSGGERNRLALARMLLQPFNVLVMDEPTNHLDIPSKKVLKEALQHFEGTLILVSHDRDFLQGLTDRVYEFRDGAVKPFLGDIDFYLEQRAASDFRAIEKGDPAPAPQAEAPSNTRGGNDHELRKKKRSLNNRLGSLESDIAGLEKEIGEMDYQLQMDYDQTVADPAFFDRYQERKTRLEGLMEKWEALSEELEGLN